MTSHRCNPVSTGLNAAFRSPTNSEPRNARPVRPLADIAAQMDDVGSSPQFGKRIGAMQKRDDLVIDLGGKRLRIRTSDQSLVIGSDGVALGACVETTLKNLAPLLAKRLSQMDGGAA
jgi:hypothetical protein